MRINKAVLLHHANSELEQKKEQERIEKRLLKSGVKLYPRHILTGIQPDSVTIKSTLTEIAYTQACDGVVLVTDRIPNDSLFSELSPALQQGKLHSLKLIGDAEAPNIIAQAIFSGHLAARNFDELINPDETPFKIERTAIHPA